jgi:hypothetical protein
VLRGNLRRPARVYRDRGWPQSAAAGKDTDGAASEQ